jgi:exosortase/archaeosortase family protein
VNRGKRKVNGQGETAAGIIKALLRRHTVFSFLFFFAMLMGIFCAFWAFFPFYDRILYYYLNFNAQVAGCILKVLGQDVAVGGSSISSQDFSITVKRGCDAIEPTALFVSAVLAFPSRFSRKITGIIAGALFLAVLNLVRIVSLFLVGLYLPSAFEIMHADVWQGIFIFLAILLWVLWLIWTGESRVLVQKQQVCSVQGRP